MTTRKIDLDRENAEEKNFVPFRANSKANDNTAALADRMQPTVEQWLCGFHDDEFIVTDSFHACVFSILFQKPFIAVSNVSRDMSRFDSLLEMLKLKNKMLNRFTSPQANIMSRLITKRSAQSYVDYEKSRLNTSPEQCLDKEVNIRKIGILTFHCAHNYGAVLQCFALQEYLKILGHEVCVINYRPSYLKYGLFIWYNWLSLNPVKCIKKIIKQLRSLNLQYKRFKAFESFIHRRLNVKSINLQSVHNDIDCFVFGSDQIWRKNNNQFDPIYFGEFKAAHGHKLISYAASMGLDKLSETEKGQISKWLKNFSIITVRETSLKQLLSPLTDKKIDVVVDPTFLLSQQEWMKIARTPDVDKPYILIYQVIPNPLANEIADIAAKKLKAEIIEIASKVNNTQRNHRVVYTASPEEFLGWIMNARFVVTTSFHGTAFSVIFNKAFVSIKQNKPSDLRIKSILNQFQLIDRFIGINNWKWKEQLLLPTKSSNRQIINLSQGVLNHINVLN